MADGSLFLTRYTDLLTVYRDKDAYSSDKKVEFKPKFGSGLVYEHHTTSLVFNDPPLHTEVRSILQDALSPRALVEAETEIISLVDNLLVDLAHTSQPDLISDFAAAIPVEVIGNLLGIPKGDRAPLRQWSLDILGALEPQISTQNLASAERAVEEFLAYLRELVADRRENLRDPNSDVLSRLIQAKQETGRLSEKELLHNCIFLLNAGHETTTNLIGNALALFSSHLDQRQKLLEQPKLSKTAIEEVLRFESSNQLGNRLCVKQRKLSGHNVVPGTPITLCIGAANRDPDVFFNPHKFDIERTPNRHLAFGSGHHVCLGMTLARLEASIAITRFIQTFPNYTLSEGVKRSDRVRFRGYTKLPVSLN